MSGLSAGFITSWSERKYEKAAYLLSIFHVDWNLEIETDKYGKQFILSVCLIVFFISINREGVREGILWLVESIKNNSVVRPPMQKEIT